MKACLKNIYIQGGRVTGSYVYSQLLGSERTRLRLGVDSMDDARGEAIATEQV